MENHLSLIIITLLFLIFGLFSKLSERSFITGPMVFLTVGLIASPLATDLIDIKFDTDIVKILAELTLIIILFVDASYLSYCNLRKLLSGIPARLLLIGLPLTMMLGTLTAQYFFPEYSLWMLVLLALILSPTDAALGQAVVESEQVPKRIKESISIESGLNDGIALPPILFCIALLASGSSVLNNSGYWLTFLASQLVLGPLVGAIVGFVGGRLIDYATHKNWMNHAFHHIVSIALALLAYSAAEFIHGNGFIAAFFAGLTLSTKIPLVRDNIQEFSEAQGKLLALIIFFLFGLVCIPAFYSYWTLNIVIYALLSLTLIRMIPVFIALIGIKIDLYSKFFIAWFGPRGIASILYLLIVIDELKVTGYETLLAAIVLTVSISVFAHGLSAVFMSNRFKELVNNNRC
ncbi:MAG: sodium:proton antiporter [Gammaproteobacteria bacterium]|nr:MAG: sodium:proton antiporter [Gammaproteobacteria bacterium]